MDRSCRRSVPVHCRIGGGRACTVGSAIRHDRPPIDQACGPVRDGGHLVVHAIVLAESRAFIAMLRRAGFATHVGAGALGEVVLALTDPRGREIA
jgi:hypothetical protein